MQRKFFWRGYLLGLVLAAGLSSGAFYFTFIHQADISLPEMALVDLQDRPVEFAQWAGQPIIVNYWATWCGPCIEEFPLFESAKQQAGKRVVLLMVSDEPAAKIRAFRRQHTYSFVFLRARKSFPGVNVRPVTYVFDKNKTLLSKHTGTWTLQRLQKLLEDL